MDILFIITMDFFCAHKWSYGSPPPIMLTTVHGRHGRQKIIPPKNAKKIIKFIKYFVEINKYKVNINRRQKRKEVV